jgi:hypothetical protein
MIQQILAAAIAPITNIFAKKVERKIARDELKTKAAIARQSDATQITLTDAEWEIVKATAEGGTWKDEYITIITTAPIALIIAGSLLSALYGDASLLDGAIAGVQALNDVGIPMPELMTAAVFAGLGLKLWRA